MKLTQCLRASQMAASFGCHGTEKSEGSYASGMDTDYGAAYNDLDRMWAQELYGPDASWYAFDEGPQAGGDGHGSTNGFFDPLGPTKYEGGAKAPKGGGDLGGTGGPAGGNNPNPAIPPWMPGGGYYGGGGGTPPPPTNDPNGNYVTSPGGGGYEQRSAAAPSSFYAGGGGQAPMPRDSSWQGTPNNGGLGWQGATPWEGGWQFDANGYPIGPGGVTYTGAQHEASRFGGNPELRAQMEAGEAAGGPTWEQWFQEVSRINGEQAAAAGGTPYDGSQDARIAGGVVGAGTHTGRPAGFTGMAGYGAAAAAPPPLSSSMTSGLILPPAAQELVASGGVQATNKRAGKGKGEGGGGNGGGGHGGGGGGTTPPGGGGTTPPGGGGTTPPGGGGTTPPGGGLGGAISGGLGPARQMPGRTVGNTIPQVLPPRGTDPRGPQNPNIGQGPMNPAQPGRPQPIPPTGRTIGDLVPYRWGSGGATGNRNASGKLLFQQYLDMMRNPDIDARTRNDMSVQAGKAARARYAGAAEQIGRAGAATGATAGNPAALAYLARDEAGTIADTNRDLRLEFEKERQRRKELGITGMSDLYGTETGYTTSLLGGRSGTALKPKRTGAAGASSETRGSLDFGSIFSMLG